MSLPRANNGNNSAVAEVDEHVGRLPSECSRWSNGSRQGESLNACVCAQGGHFQQLLWHCLSCTS